MDNTSYIEYLQRHIKPWSRLVSGNRELNCRCFYCPDSDDTRHGHFYINVDLSKDEPSYFYCQKCHVKGIVTSQKLLEWNIYDANLALDITKYNKRILSLPTNLKYNNKYIYNINNYKITEDNLSLYKLNYINNRLGINLSYKDCIEKKIVLNLRDILNPNNLQYTRHPNIIDQLDANFLGFLSYDNAFINMRNLGLKEVYHTIDKRYVNYNIFDKYDNTTKFYIIPNKLDILKPVEVHITEGPFDILSVLYNLHNGKLGNNIYGAATGSSYMGMLKFIMLNMKIPGMIIHFYPDNDIDDYKISRIKNDLRIYNNIYIHRNLYPGEKDFGVRKEKIDEGIIVI